MKQYQIYLNLKFKICKIKKKNLIVLSIPGKQRGFHLVFIIFTKFMTTKAKQFTEKKRRKRNTKF